jgi:hypothetical protein
MKKLMDFGKSPWPLLILMAMTTVVAVLTSLDWSDSQSHPDRSAELPLEEPKL